MFADLIVTNGTVYSMLDPGHQYESLAVKDGLIFAAGSSPTVAEYRGSRTQVLDLNGGVAFPGFTDVHTHLLAASIRHSHDLNLSHAAGISKIPDALDAIRRWQPPSLRDGWVIGRQYQDHLVDERRFPNREELDSVVPDRPALIVGVGQHVASANSAALTLAGIRAETADPPGGVIERTADGRPTGVLFERAKADVMACIPQLSFTDRLTALVDQVETILLRFGITSVGAMADFGPDDVRAYTMAVLEHNFPVRLNLLLRVFESQMDVEQLGAAGVVSNLGSSKLKIDGVKMSIDGGWNNAALYGQSTSATDDSGVIRIPQGDLDTIACRAHDLGLRNVLHAFGPRAYDMALNSLEKAAGRGLRSDFRDRIEHFGLMPVTDVQVRRCHAIGAIASPQPSFLYYLGEEFAHALGEEAMSDSFPFRKLLQSGVRVAGSSDLDCTPASVLAGVQAAVTRRTAQGNIFGPDEAISVYEALRMYTIDAAYCQFEEESRGTLAPGRLADLTVLGADPFEAAPEHLVDIPVVMTVVGGHVKYDRRGPARDHP